MDTTDHDTTRQQDTGRNKNQEQAWQQQRPAKNKGKATTKQPAHLARQSKEDASPERRAYNVPVDPNRIKNMHHNRIQPLQEERSQGAHQSQRRLCLRHHHL